jgi:hypothetical protein
MKSASRPATPAMQYLGLIRKSLAKIRRDLPNIIDIGQRMAGHLLAGGEYYCPPVAEWWPSEHTHRAGGLMGLRSGRAKGRHDVALITAPDIRRCDLAKNETLAALLKSKANIFVVGRDDDFDGAGAPAGRFEGFTGSAGWDEGLYAFGRYKPLAPLRHFETIVRGWVTVGEMITACIRGGKMPTIWMSVWLEGSLVRNNAFMQHDNLQEPWFNPLFHNDRFIPPLPAGYAADEFLRPLEQMLTGLETQAAKLSQAGDWLAQAKAAGKKIWTVLVGHSYPRILELPMQKESAEHGKDYDYPLHFYWSISDLGKAFPKTVGRGDVGLHLGYAPVNVPALQKLMQRGIRLVHTTPYGKPPGLKEPKGLLWLDLPWRPADATVDIPGYSVRVLPGSSSAQTMAYNAILCELADRMGWK